MTKSVWVMLVEDEFFIRELLEEALLEGGYKVQCELEGAKAIKGLEDQPRFAGLITDINLADATSGWEVARSARAINPKIAVVYMSGDCADEYAKEGVPNSAFLKKPFAADQISTALSNLLNDIT